MPDFLRLDILDCLDILLVGLLIYYVYKIIKGTAAVNIFFGVLLFYVLWLIVKALHMELLTAILDKIISVGVLAFLIVFQPEIRRFLLRMGSRTAHDAGRYTFLGKLFHSHREGVSKNTASEIAQACSRLSDNHTGALIAVAGNASLDYITETGDTLDAVVNHRLIENLFFKNSPLHDGGVVISHNRVISARCTFPMSESTEIPAHFGMRHRAAVGLSEQTDALIVVVSEETSLISIAQGGQLRTLSGASELRLAIESAFS